MTEPENADFVIGAYEALYRAHRDPVGDRAFYERLAREIGGPILELGCGTGRILGPLHALGIECVGVDSSPGALTRMAMRYPELETRCVPMQSVELGDRRFRLILSGFRGFQHLYSVEDQLAVLGKVREHLTPDGRFAFDVFDPDLELLAPVEEPEFRDLSAPFEGGEIVRFASVRRDHAEQMMHIWFRFEHRVGEELRAEAADSVHMRWFYRYEIEHLLARAGFAIEHLYSDYDGGDYDGGGDIVVVCRKC